MWRIGLCLVCVVLGSSGCLRTVKVQRATPPDTQVSSPDVSQPDEVLPTPRLFDVTVPLIDF
jgi:hypothetical protein